MASRRRVAITGLGALTPVGNTAAEFWDGLAAGRSGVRPITTIDTEGIACKIAGTVVGYDAEDHFPVKESRRIERFAQFAVVVSREAYAHSGIESEGLDPFDIGCVMGVGIGGIGETETSSVLIHERGRTRVSPFLLTRIIPNMSAGYTSIDLGIKGPNLCVTTACAAGTHAIGEAAEIIRRGQAKAMIAGGAESAIVPIAMAAFGKMKAMCTDSNDCPEKASRPFDATRAGFVMGEGAAALMLEDWDLAQSRGAKILGEILGYGLSSDAFHVTQPAADGAGNAHAMNMALKQAGLTPDRIGYINAHGTSTPMNDKCETACIKRVFGEHASKLAISSTKSMTGHLFGAAGAIEAVATVQALIHQTLPPTINYENPDPDCDLDCVPNEARKVEGLKIALSNNLGFGGHNASIIIATGDDDGDVK